MKVFQLVMKDETNEKRKDDMRKTCETYTTDELLTTPLLGSHVRIHIQLCKFFQFFFFLNLVQEILDPILAFFIRTRNLSISLKAANSLSVHRLGFHPHANASETTGAYGTNVDNISREALSAGHDGANHPFFPY